VKSVEQLKSLVESMRGSNGEEREKDMRYE
jgi:hypothetical protein